MLIDTPRLRLRPLTWADAEAVFAYGQQPEIMTFMSWKQHSSIDDAYNFIMRSKQVWAAETNEVYGIELKSSGKLVGTIEIDWMDNCRARIGYVLNFHHWGQGIMTEALTHVIDYVWEREHIVRVEAIVDVDNTASWRVMEKAGMQREARLRNFVVLPQLTPEVRDMYMYVKLPEPIE